MVTESREIIPYIGPRPFEEQDRDLFFGRDSQAIEVLSLIIAHRIFLLYAQSGAGKTSLINAGVIPLLKEEGFEVLPLARVRGLIPKDIKTEEIPNLYAFNTLMSWSGDGADPRRLLSLSIADFLRKREHLTNEENLTSPRVVVFDQFEELFAFYPERWRDREGFIKQVREALEEDPLLRMFFVMREDYIAQLDPYISLLTERLRTRFRLERLRKEAALSAVTGPLAGTKRSFAKGVEEKLVEDLMNVRVETDAGETVVVTGEFIEPVQLQVVCASLLEDLPSDVTVITADHLQKFGDVTQALSGFYEKAIERAVQETGVKEGDLRRWFGRTLITPAGTRGTAYRGREKTGDISNAVIDVLENMHLIRGEWRGGGRWYELSHDRFIEPIQESNQKWLSKRAGAVQTRQHLEERTAKWVQLKRSSEGLLDEVELVEAERWLDNPESADLGYSETLSALIQASRAAIEEGKRQKELEQARELAEEQKRRAEVERERADEQAKSRIRLRRFSVALVVLIIFAIFATLFAIKESRRANLKSRIAKSSRLAAESLNSLEVDKRLDLSALLGLESYRVAEEVKDEVSPNEARDILSKARGTLGNVFLYTPYDSYFLRGHEDRVYSVAFSPDRKTLASGSTDETIILWDAEKRKQIGEPLEGHEGWVTSVAFSPAGKTLASGSRDKTIILWDMENRQQIGKPLKAHKDWVTSVAFSADGHTLVSGSGDKTIILWNVKKREFITRLPTGHNDEVSSLALSPDGKTLASASKDKTIILWDMENRQQIGKPLKAHKDWVTSVAFSANRKTLASGSRDRTIILWDVEDVKKPQQIGKPLKGHHAEVFSVAFSPNGKTLGSGSRDNTVILWNIEEREQIGKPLEVHKDWVRSVAFSPDEKTLASVSADKNLILWDIGNVKTIGRPNEFMTSFSFCPDGKTLASGSEKGSITLWNVETGQPIGQPLTEHKSWVASLTFSPDGKTLASGSENGNIILWDVDTGEPIRPPLTGHANWVVSLAFSPDGKTLASGSWDDSINLWDVKTGKPIGPPLTGHNDWVVSVAFGPDGKSLASGSRDRTIILWDVEDVKKPQQIGKLLKGHDDWVVSLSFTPDGKSLASGSRDTSIILWDVEDVKKPQQIGTPLNRHTDWVVSLAFSPDGKTLASGSNDNSIILWDVTKGKPKVRPIIGHNGGVFSMAFSPDGKTLMSASVDKTLMLSDVSFLLPELNFELFRDWTCPMANRNLDCDELNDYIEGNEYDPTCPNLPHPACPEAKDRD